MSAALKACQFTSTDLLITHVLLPLLHSRYQESWFEVAYDESDPTTGPFFELGTRTFDKKQVNQGDVNTGLLKLAGIENCNNLTSVLDLCEKLPNTKAPHQLHLTWNWYDKDLTEKYLEEESRLEEAQHRVVTSFDKWQASTAKAEGEKVSKSAPKIKSESWERKIKKEPSIGRTNIKLELGQDVVIKREPQIKQEAGGPASSASRPKPKSRSAPTPASQRPQVCGSLNALHVKLTLLDPSYPGSREC
jgi:hypothetical protein